MKEKILTLLTECYFKLKDIEISTIETDKDIVTEGDIALGNLIRNTCLDWDDKLCICTEELPEGISNNACPKYCIFVDELDGTDNAYRNLSIFPSVTLIQIAEALSSDNVLFSDFVAVAAVEHSHGDIYIALQNEGIERYHINTDRTLLKEEIVPKHPKQDVVITDVYSMMDETDILMSIAKTVQTKDFGSSAASYCHVATGMFEAYASSHKKGHELPLLYLLCKEAGLEFTDFAGRSYDNVKYDFDSKRYQVIAGIPSTCVKLQNVLSPFAKEM